MSYSYMLMPLHIFTIRLAVDGTNENSFWIKKSRVLLLKCEFKMTMGSSPYDSPYDMSIN